MGFYHPATIVKDAQRHGLKILPIDVTKSDWKCTLETTASSQLSVDDLVVGCPSSVGGDRVDGHKSGGNQVINGVAPSGAFAPATRGISQEAPENLDTSIEIPWEEIGAIRSSRRSIAEKLSIANANRQSQTSASQSPIKDQNQHSTIAGHPPGPELLAAYVNRPRIGARTPRPSRFTIWLVASQSFADELIRQNGR
jgi:DNA polymerase III alpha subunit